MKKQLTYSLATLSLVSLMLVSTVPAYAQSTTGTTHPNFFQGLVDFIAQKFGLDKTQVQTAVKDYQTRHKANFSARPTLTPEQINAREKTRLDKFVSEGKITSSQEQAIITELAALRSKYNPDTMKGLTPEERRTKIQQMRDEIVSWAKSQGIDSSYVLPGFVMGEKVGMGRGMMRGRFGHWQKPSTTPPPSQ